MWNNLVICAQRLTQDALKHLRWSFLGKQLTGEAVTYFHKKLHLGVRLSNNFVVAIVLPFVNILLRTDCLIYLWVGTYCSILNSMMSVTFYDNALLHKFLEKNDPL